MKILALLILSASLAVAVPVPMSDVQANKIADAIFKVENSTTYPYGIKSIPLQGNTQEERTAYARKICLNTIRNNFVRYQTAGSKGDFFEFLGSKYCPGSNLPQNKCNKYWLPNLRKLIGYNTYEEMQKMSSGKLR